MWEMFHLGLASPYGADKETMNDVKIYLRNGQRLLKPNLCPESVYDLMKQCWLANHEDRLTFSELNENFKQLLGETDAEVIDEEIVSNTIPLLSVENTGYIDMGWSDENSTTTTNTRT